MYEVLLKWNVCSTSVETSLQIETTIAMIIAATLKASSITCQEYVAFRGIKDSGLFLAIHNNLMPSYLLLITDRKQNPTATGSGQQCEMWDQPNQASKTMTPIFWEPLVLLAFQPVPCYVNVASSPWLSTDQDPKIEIYKVKSVMRSIWTVGTERVNKGGMWRWER